jgi:SAM-dependent methyltransferase
MGLTPKISAHEAGNTFTRGKGLLETFLAQQRAKMANRLIPAQLRHGRILDIGCGTYPYFLAHTEFSKKFAIDQLPMPQKISSNYQIEGYSLNLNQKPSLPFENDFFNIVTLLAVVEHLNPDSTETIFREIHRILHPGGKVIITTPAAWSDGLLHLMAHLGLVSTEEIDEHAYAYTLPLIGWYFGQAGFEMKKLKFGYFEMMLNMWAVAEK